MHAKPNATNKISIEIILSGIYLRYQTLQDQRGKIKEI